MLRNIEAVQGLSNLTRSALGPHGKQYKNQKSDYLKQIVNY